MKYKNRYLGAGKRMNKLYKGHYLIAAYYGGPQNDEYLYGVYNNAADLAKQAGLNVESVMCALTRIGKNERSGMLLYRQEHGVKKLLRVTIHFIPLTKEEIESGDFDNYE